MQLPLDLPRLGDQVFEAGVFCPVIDQKYFLSNVVSQKMALAS